eukprot:COSAG05_NODE_12579_length_462_cov_1.278237_1_plen_91_part_10
MLAHPPSSLSITVACCVRYRPILFSLCGWNAWYSPPDPALGYGGGKTLGNSWRIGPDDTNWHGVLTNIDINAELAPYAGPVRALVALVCPP